MARTWVAWDGHPKPVDDRVYTPNKAIRRLADHMLDHLMQIEAMAASHPPMADEWRASACTSPADLAPFTKDDLDEATSRLRRLADLWALRLRSFRPADLDARQEDSWSVREIAFHLVESIAYYSGAVGFLN